MEETDLANKRVFIAFAAEDIRYRDLFVGQKQLKDTPFDFTDNRVAKNRVQIYQEVGQ
jgi:hypothetical protein